MNSQWAAAFTLEQVSEQLLKILFDVSVLAAMFSRAVRVKVNCSTSVFFFNFSLLLFPLL